MVGRFTAFKYNIEACWYGPKPTGTKPDSKCVKSVLKGLKSWVSSVASISETAIDDESFYVKECVSAGDHKYIVILWQTTSRDASSTALDISSKPGGKSRIEQHSYPDGYKPGCPLYYYLDVKEMSVYVLKPDNATMIGREIFEHLMKFVMMFHSGELQQVLKNPDGEALVVGYVDASPRKNGVFRIVPSMDSVEVNEILSRAPDIRKFVHAVRLDSETQTIFETFMSALMKHLDISIPSCVEKGAKSIRYEANVNLDEEALRELIKHQQRVGVNERIGFVVRDNGSPRTLWADKVGGYQFVLPRIKPNNGVYSGSDLIKTVPKFLEGVK